MDYLQRFLPKIVLLFMFFCAAALAEDQVRVPILVYHRFATSAVDSMTIPVSEFASQMKWLKDNNYNVIPLKTLVSYLRGQGPAPAPKSVVITADDGHKSVLTYMTPIVEKYKIPVTLFIYPSAISNASYAMTWDDLHKLQQTGLFDIQGHTYWHPNFKKEKKRLPPDEYEKFVGIQFDKSKAVLEKKLNTKVELLAWPFGIYDDDLEKDAEKSGYVAAFSIDARYADKTEKMMSQPRYMIVSATTLKEFESILSGQSQGKGIKAE